MKNTSKKSVLLDAVILVAMSVLLFYGISWGIFSWYTDPAKYECYAVAFWHGDTALKTLQVSALQCKFIAQPSAAPHDAFVSFLMAHHAPHWFITFVLGQSPAQPLHALPYEYPLLTLLLFSFSLFAVPVWSQVAFAIAMECAVISVYLTLRIWRSQKAALAFAIYVVIGCWSTAAARFDIVPAGLTLGALLLAQHKRWRWAYILLALSTLLKFYPIVLLPVFLIAQYKTSHTYWYKLWRGLDAFIAVCASVTGLSLLLSVEGTLSPLGYFGDRPIQVESSAASILWLASFFGFPLHYDTNFGSLNVTSPLSGIVSPLFTIAFLVALVYVYWLHWRGHMQLPLAVFMVLLMVIFLSKVFSPQYLLWITPFVAYVGEWNKWWLFSWTAISVVTTWIFPFIYLSSHQLLHVPDLPVFNPAVLARNIILLTVVIVMIIYCRKRRERIGIPDNESISTSQPDSSTVAAHAD